MANKTISEYTAATSIDASNDYLLIEQAVGPIYKKINRNTLLALASAPLGTSDTQSPTNKTFDNTNTFTIRDDRLTIQDNADTTKQVALQLSGITTGTTRTLTIPDASTTLVGTDATQTLTNKTLTSPTINGGTIDNSTITVDSISGKTSTTIVSVAGVQLNNGTIGTANAVTASSILAGAVTPEKLVSGAGTSWAWQSWTPTWTNLTVGNGTTNYRYTQIGKTVHFRGSVIFGSTSAMSTTPTFTLPVTSSSNYTASRSPLGASEILDSGTADHFGPVIWLSTTTAKVSVFNAAGTYLTFVDVTSAIPMTWATNDGLFFWGSYEVA